MESRRRPLLLDPEFPHLRGAGSSSLVGLRRGSLAQRTAFCLRIKQTAWSRGGFPRLQRPSFYIVSARITALFICILTSGNLLDCANYDSVTVPTIAVSVLSVIVRSWYEGLVEGCPTTSYPTFDIT